MAALRAAVFPLSAKNRRGGHFLPPSSARVNADKQVSKVFSKVKRSVSFLTSCWDCMCNFSFLYRMLIADELSP